MGHQGIGENAPLVRARICEGLSLLGIELNESRNAEAATVISTDASRATVRVIRTDEDPNPGSQAGVVPPLAPISRGLFSDDPVAFAANIDRVIQQGATPPGPAPALQMPAFGTTHSLTLPEIANVEAYVLSLNGVDAAKIIHPGISPLHFGDRRSDGGPADRRGWQAFQEIIVMAKDPICGMTVDEATALHAEHGRGTFYFCSERCRKKFQSPSATVKHEENAELRDMTRRFW
ncbi:MAG TPA: hypothetical protein VFD66_12110, partial [Verrucomicrobiae bacterium]|nr:hypothetical protein [Verrucomicrobiae bacterium]